MRYPSGFARHMLWGCALLLCFGIALRYEGHGLVMDWLILSALLIWHTRAMNRGARAAGPY
jgi:hypothetical protein